LVLAVDPDSINTDFFPRTVNLSEPVILDIAELMTFEEPPVASEIKDRASKIASTVVKFVASMWDGSCSESVRRSLPKNWKTQEETIVTVFGPDLFLVGPLEKAFQDQGIIVVYPMGDADQVHWVTNQELADSKV
jgi:hypothetical protein